jgi:hypothetical protein
MLSRLNACSILTPMRPVRRPPILPAYLKIVQLLSCGGKRFKLPLQLDLDWLMLTSKSIGPIIAHFLLPSLSSKISGANDASVVMGLIT